MTRRRRRMVMQRSAAEREQLAELDRATRSALETYDLREHGLDPNTPESWERTWADATATEK